VTSQPPVYLVDDDRAVRDAVALLLSTYGLRVETFAHPLDFLSRQPELEPGCIVLDLRMPAITGLQLQQKLQESGCGWPIVLLTGHGDMQACRRAFKAGAVDFLSKPVDEHVLMEAINAAFAALARYREQDEQRALLARLTERERQVLALVAQGYATKEIAAALELSPRTVETHRAHISEKIGSTSVVEFARLAQASQEPGPGGHP